jgi:exopolysaccharide production protein ExoQ
VLYSPNLDARAAEVERVDFLQKGSPLRRMTYPLLGLYGLLSLVQSGIGRPSPRGRLGWLIVFCVCWAFLSVTWSDDVGLTIRRLISFGMFCLGSLALGWRLSPRQIGSFLMFLSGAFVLVGLVAEIDLGTFSPLTSWYRFTGTQHPNSQAICCSVLLLSSVYLADVSKERGKFFLSVAGLAFVFLVLTKSRTSFAAAMVALILMKSISQKKSKSTAVIIVVTLLLAVSVMVMGDRAISALGSGVNLGRSSEGVTTLNSRTWLWMECRGYAGQRPVLGYGFNGFWTPERLMRISETQGWGLGSAHSIYIDLLLNLGLVGLFGFVMVIITAMLRARSALTQTGDRGYAFLLAFLVFYSLHGLLESIFINPGYAAFMSMVVFSHLAFSNYCDRISE